MLPQAGDRKWRETDPAGVRSSSRVGELGTRAESEQAAVAILHDKLA